MPSLLLLVNTREPQSIKAKLALPIIPIAIVAYAFTLLWDNLCRNSCIMAEYGQASIVQFMPVKGYDGLRKNIGMKQMAFTMCRS